MGLTNNMAGGQADWEQLHSEQQRLLAEAQSTSEVTKRTLRVSVAALIFTVLGILVAIVIAIQSQTQSP